MDPISLSQLATWSNATLVHGANDPLVLGISHDTRTIKPGELYIAFRGEHVDGHLFLEEARKKGAVGALCDGVIPSDVPADFGIVHVASTIQGLTTLASRWRGELGLRSIVLTGSNGKTSAKDFTTALLKNFLQVTSTQGNFNNHIGLPLSMLKAMKSDQVAVWEIGMNHAGEIAPLAKLARPEVAVITNIGTAHIGLLGSREAIADEKGSLLVELSSSGLAILPAADDFYEALASRTQARILSVGIGVGDLQATDVISVPKAKGTEFNITYQGVSLRAFLPVIGVHMVQNALFALAVSLECGVLLQEGVAALRDVEPSYGRLQLVELSDIMLVDDSYNANPDSMEAAISSIRGLKAQRRIAILGCMGELGDYAMKGYERVGLKAAALLDLLIVVHDEAFPLAEVARNAGMKEVYHVHGNTEATKLALSIIRGGDVILVKGSNRAHLHEVVEALRQALQKPNQKKT